LVVALIFIKTMGLILQVLVKQQQNKQLLLRLSFEKLKFVIFIQNKFFLSDVPEASTIPRPRENQPFVRNQMLIYL